MQVLPSTINTNPTTPLAIFHCIDHNWSKLHYCSRKKRTAWRFENTFMSETLALLSISNGLAPTKSALTGSTSLPPCVDHDHRCLQVSYKNLLCNPNALPDTKRYAIQTCPFTCNYCAEYLAGFTPTLTTGPPCEDKMNCTILVASNTCDVPIVKTRCAKSCNICSQGTLLNVQPVG
ncbi:uncharacterized protein LOC134705769 [Mytilus trossulus]|uniref:uncharacterized protein LOC134705769 n=1 Tax=Mytilus trossulus TaxID=6551 RepID=UPI0030040110